MLADQFQAAAERARTLAQLDDVSRLLWRAHAEHHVDDGRAGAISEAVEARRARIKGMRPAPLPSPPCARRRRPRSPDRARSIERRRRQAASGAMPPTIASRFTVGEQSALAIVGREAQRAGRCDLYIDAIAAMAGVCRSVVQSALREAGRLGLVRVTERRIPGRKSLSNLVEVTDQAWRAWLAIGFRKTNTTVTSFKNRTESALRSAEERESERLSAHAFRRPMPATVGGGGTKTAFEDANRKNRATSP
jgi:hypothetical protein